MIYFFKRYQKAISALILVGLFQSFVLELCTIYANPLPFMQQVYYSPILDREEEDSPVLMILPSPNKQLITTLSSSEVLAETSREESSVTDSSTSVKAAKPVPEGESTTLYQSDLLYGVIGVNEKMTYDNPEDNLFNVNIQETIDKKAIYVLSYELYGASSATEVAKSINTSTSMGGYLKAKTKTWTRVEEYISPTHLKQGVNTVLFTADQQVGSQYLVRHLQIEKRTTSEVANQLQLNTPIRDSLSGRVYLSGVIPPIFKVEESALYISGNRIPLDNHHFEYTAIGNKDGPLLVELKEGEEVVDKQIVNFSTSRVITKEEAFNAPFERYEYAIDVSKEFSVYTPSKVGIQLPEGSSQENFKLSIQELRPRDYASTGMAMTNVTANKSAYRFLPDGVQFDREVLITLPYDLTAIPRGYSAKDIQVFYFDTQLKQWEKVKVVDVVEETQQIVALTTHFTDYLAGIIQEPENPDGQAFTPTILQGVQVVNPTENIPMVSVPQINDQGDAALAFPLILPQGRHGMTPDISLKYNSGSDEGDFGLGWSLSIPTISVDTRWGVPQYDAVKETESYLLNGEELLLEQTDHNLYTPHKAPLIDRVENVSFQKVQSNPNLEIKRLGSVNEYSWEISDKTTGWIYTYKTYSKGKWYLTRVNDLYGNHMNYLYKDNGNGDYQLSEISYNLNPLLGDNVSNEFRVVISRKKNIDSPSGARQDVKTNNRFGTEVNSIDLIDKIQIGTHTKLDYTVRLANETVHLGNVWNDYEFYYKAGQFGRSLLTKIINKNYNNNTSISSSTSNQERPLTEEYNLDYYDDIGSGSLFETNGQTINTYKDYATEYDKFGINLSSLGGTEGKTTNYNGGGSVGIVTPIFPDSWLPFSQSATIGGSLGGGSSNAETKTLMIDIDGDGLPDKVFKDGGSFYYRKNLGGSFSTTVFPIKNLPNLNYTKGKNNDKSFSVNVLSGNVTRSNSSSSSTITTYVTDVNADGIPDVVDNERVYFGYIDPQTKAPTYTLDSSITPVIILKEEEVAPILNPEPQEEMTNGPMDIVLVWRAPKPGEITVSGTISKQHITLESGVKFSIERLKENEEGDATFVLGPNLMLSTEESHRHTLTVEKGELLFFRAHTNQIPIEELGVSWNPKVQYIGENPDPIISSSRHTSSYQDGFILGTNREYSFQNKGQYRLEWPSFTITDTDQVTIRVSHFKKGAEVGAGGNIPVDGNSLVVYEKRSTIEGTTTFASPNQLLDMSSITDVPSSFHYLKVEVLSDSEVNWKWIDDHFKPKLVSLDSNNPAIYLTPYYTNYSKVHTSNIPLKYTAEGPNVQVVINNNFTLSGCTEAVCKDRYVYLVARYPSDSIIPLVNVNNSEERRGYVKFRYKFDERGHMIQKQRLNANYQYENLDNTYEFRLSSTIGSRYFFEYYTTEDQIGKLLDLYQNTEGTSPPPPLISLRSSGVNPTSYMVGVDGNGKVKANIYTSESTEAWGPMYRNWGQFSYKGADPKKDYLPIVGKNIKAFNTANNTTSSGQTMNDILENPNSDLDAIENEMDEIERLSGNLSEYFGMLLPNKELNRWQNHEHLYVSANAISPYTRFLTDDIPDLRPPAVAVGSFGAAGINKYTSFKNNSTTISVGYWRLSFGRTKTKGSSELTNDFMDINGDGFPDIIGRSVQLTAKRGGLSSRILNADFTTRTTLSGSGSLVGGANVVAKGSMTIGSGKSTAKNIVIGNQASAAINGSSFTTTNTSNHFFVDINGDGLIDIVQHDGSVLLNYGGEFRAGNSWSSLAIEQNKTITKNGGGTGSATQSGNFTGLSNLDISLGLSLSSSSSSNQVSYMDLNGDGLPEKIEQGKYFINTGLGFQSTGYPMPGTPVQQSIEGGVNGNLTICVYFPVPIIFTGPKFCFSVGGASGKNISNEQGRFMDFDGDGFVDYVTSNKNESITVYKSRIKRTNLLKTVTQSTGAKIELDYDIVNPIDQTDIGSTYKMPYKKWALTKVAIYDGFEGDGENTIQYAYEYFNGYKDRKERSFLGFGKTKAHLLHADGQPFRTEVTEYVLNEMTENELYQPGTSSGLKQYIYKKGLPQKISLFDKQQRIFSETTYNYKFYTSRLLHDAMDIDTQISTAAEVDVYSEKMSVLPLVTSIITKKWTYEDENNTSVLVNQTQQNFTRYDNLGNLKTYKDVDRGLTVEMTYNLGPKTLPTSHKISLTATGIQLRLTTATPTSDGLNYEQIENYASDNESLLTLYKYDFLGNLIEKTLADRFTYKYEYTDFNTNSNNRQGSYFWLFPSVITDPFGNTTRIHRNAFGLPVVIQDVYKENIIYKYDAFNRLQSVKGPYENEWTIRHTYVNNRTSITQHNIGDGNILHTSMLTDGLGRVVQVKKQLENDVDYIGCNAMTPVLRFSVSGKTKYDEFGRPIESYLPEEELVCEPLTPQQSIATMLTTYFPTTDVEERKTMMTYDNFDRMLEQKVYGTDALTRMTYGFVGDQLTTRLVLPEGNTSISYFDKLGQKTKETQIDGTEQLETTFDYDALGQLKKVTNADNQSATFEYDLLGRMTQKETNASGITKYTYDSLSQLIEKTDANESIIHYTYDFNRLIKIEGEELNTNFEYEEGGRVKRMKDKTGYTDYKYGKLGEIVYEMKYIPDEHDRAHYFNTKYKYDSWGRLLEMVYPDKEKLFYQYNSVGQLIRIVNEDEFEYLSDVKYNHFDQPYSIHYGNKVELQQEFDMTERLRAAQLSAPRQNNSNATSLVARNVYGYDKNNNITEMYNNYTQNNQLNIGGVYSKSFEYDGYNRLVYANATWDGLLEKHDYRLNMKYNKDHGIASKDQLHQIYDKNSRETHATENAFEREYLYKEGSPRVQVIQGKNSEGEPFKQVYQYAANGNILSIEVDGSLVANTKYHSRNIGWDVNNNITKIDDKTIKSTFKYDGMGQRVEKKITVTEELEINGGLNLHGSYHSAETIYPNAFFTYTKGTYTKHYYANSKRLASRIGDIADHNDLSSETYNNVEVSPHEEMRRSNLRGIQVPREQRIDNNTATLASICQNQIDFLLNSLYNTAENQNCRQQILEIIDKNKTYDSQCVQFSPTGECLRHELVVNGTNYCTALEQINAQGCVELTEDGLVIDKETGYVYDPITGVPLDPITREPVDLGTVGDSFNRLELDCYNQFLTFIEYYQNVEEKPAEYELLLKYYYCLICIGPDCKICYSLPGVLYGEIPGEEYSSWILTESGAMIQFCDLVIPPIVPVVPQEPEPPIFSPVVLPPAVGDRWRDEPYSAPIPIEANPTTAVGPVWWYHSDHLGSTTYITDVTGKPCQYIEYLPFGEVMVEQSTNNILENVYKFNAKELDAQTGYYYYAARYYDPGASIFLSVDPLAEEFPAWTPYHYVHNNPINMTDPTGMRANPVFGSNGDYRGNTKEGYTGDILIYDGNKDFSKMSADELLYDNFDVNTQRGEGNTYDRVRGELSGNAKSKIWTHVASQLEGQQIYDETFSMSDLEGGKIHFNNRNGAGWFSEYRLGTRTGKISGTDKYQYDTTVENIQSSIGVHEFYSHIKKNQGGQIFSSHRLAYKNVINFKSLWNNTTDNYKGFNLQRLRDYTEEETGRKTVDPLYRNLFNKYGKYSH